MTDNIDDGYAAGRNEWKYDLSKKNNKDYNEGWSDGVKAKRQWDVMNNWD